MLVRVNRLDLRLQIAQLAKHALRRLRAAIYVELISAHKPINDLSHANGEVRGTGWDKFGGSRSSADRRHQRGCDLVPVFHGHLRAHGHLISLDPDHPNQLLTGSKVDEKRIIQFQVRRSALEIQRLVTGYNLRAG